MASTFKEVAEEAFFRFHGHRPVLRGFPCSLLPIPASLCMWTRQLLVGQDRDSKLFEKMYDNVTETLHTGYMN